MGAFCCCLCGEDFEEIDGRATTSSSQEVTPLTSTGLSTATADNPLAETYHHVPRPAPYDTDPRYSRLQRDGLVSRREKATSHIHEESQMLRRNSSSSGVEYMVSGKKRNNACGEEESKDELTESEKDVYGKMSYGKDYMVTTSEDEDVCPTCLDEYTPENPKIITKCSHHFHLGCIYEWMERSDNCPLCGKEMEFCESPS